MTILMQRLRTLQLRLNSVDPGAVRAASERILEWRSVAGYVKGAEARRRRLHAHVTNSMDSLATDFGARLENQFLPRLTKSLATLIPEVESRAVEAANSRSVELEDECDGRVRAAEKNSALADVQLNELRQASADTYRTLADFTDRLDQIWADDSIESIGGWRDAMERVKTEKDASEKASLDSLREDARGDDNEEGEPSSVRLTCPICKEPKGKRQPRTGLFEDLAGIVNVAPYRCSRCMVKFYRYRPSRKRKA
jgi:hypothetical protein